MSKVFVDSSAWIALLNKRDALHPAARQARYRLNQQGARLLTTEFVLLEVANALSRPPLRRQAIAAIESLRLSINVTILPISQDLLLDGWTLYKQRLDKEWSLTDCISFAVMTRTATREALTADHHFEQAGFKKLL